MAGRNAAFAALLLGMLMAALDTNVVVAALPTIADSLGHPAAVGGVTAGFLLTVAVATPLHGSLSDRWGRRRTFVLSVLIFAISSLGCALAPSMFALIASRAVQGIGASGLIVAAVAGMTELFDRAGLVRRQGWLTAMFAASSIGGAPLGGLLTAVAGWRAIFLVNLPISAMALALGSRTIPRRSGPARRPFDVLGAIMITIVGAAVVVLGTVPPLWTLLLAGIAVLAATTFVLVERRAASPLVPPALFADRGLTRAIAVTALSGVALFGTFTYVPLAIGAGPATTGLLLLPMSAGQLVVTSSFAVLTRRKPRIAAWGRFGLALGVLGMLGIAAIPLFGLVAGLLGLAGAGAALGLSMQAYTLIGQAQAPRDLIGAGMATLTFARQLGGSLGIAIFGWISAGASLPAAFLTAAAILAFALIIAPRDDPATPKPPHGTPHNHRPAPRSGPR
ncbi:MAG TPA: MFS transporter [Pseudonocardiaceae bacterium]|nr:MFS transporter [Pseudonocardiaceae bacterium]